MHRALEIPELIHAIASSTDDDDGRTRLAFALTCRAFLEPAIDLLWVSQDGLYNLIRCLPQDLWMVNANHFVVI